MIFIDNGGFWRLTIFGQPLVEVARKMKAIEGMQPQINDMERRLGIMQSVEPVLENAIKTLQRVVDVRGMGKK